MGLVSFLSCFFSILFSLLCLSSTNLLNIWLFLELSVLSVIPCFFGNYLYINYYKGLLYYLLLSGISSGLIFSGFLLINEGGSFISFVGFLVKFCLFPVGFWLYIVGNSSSWVVIWLVSCCSKIFTPMVNLIFSQEFFYLTQMLCILTLLFSSLYFWFGGSSLRLIWINMSISSSCVVFFLFLYSCNILSYILLIYYLIWSSICVYNLSNSQHFNNTFSSGLSIFILYSIPFSLSFFYKMLGVCALVNSPASWALILSFFIYGISEQYYLFKSWGFNWSVQDGNLVY
uniref:NADH dehydrogenase subunit 2 n=1 Tax=Capsala pricei TaxID=651779 RepID=A0A6G7WE06_9PLAT|nr:NADH dehydrogenase subunit 2 [Capsala pricei]QIK50412.1 NADH dehydrogenase subunit 2 [Capsala pricei]